MKKTYLKGWKNNPNHKYIITEEGRQQSREIAKEYLYSKNREKYLLDWDKDYIVHHIDGETFNDSVKNLYICTREQHRIIHQGQINRRQKFANSSEIDYLLKNWREPGNETLGLVKEDKKIRKELEMQRKEEEWRREREESKKIQRKRIRKKMIIISICIIAFIILFIFIFKNSIFNKQEPTSPSYNIKVKGYEIIIRNNIDREINLEIEYQRYSDWFGINQDVTTQVSIPSGHTGLFTDKWFENTFGCTPTICLVRIISHKEINKSKD